MTEEFLQYIWKHFLFSNEDTVTTKGEKLDIINPGNWNHDAGPDFFNALIRIDDTLWAGNVEVHLKSSDWNLHGHSNDQSYTNVILHVVLQNDLEIAPESREVIPVFIPEIKREIEENYNHLVNQKNWPSCHENVEKINKVYLLSEFDSLVVERLEYKTSQIIKTLNENKNNWEEAFYQHLARSFGFQANSLPFEMLARSLPLSIISKHRLNPLQLEALIFGQSGLLNEQLLGDDYYLKIREEYSYLYSMYKLRGIEGHIWKFLRMRPTNFPTVRLAQFASLLGNSESLLSNIIDMKDVKDILKLFEVKASEYWDTHYHFNKTSKKRIKLIGEAGRNILLINTVVPFLFLYGERYEKYHLKQRALDILESLPPESNNIISRWHEVGVVAQHAFDSQALIHLKKNYCDKRKCLTCQIGNKIICCI